MLSLPRLPPTRALYLAAALLASGTGSAAAQLPGESIFGNQTSLRAEYLEKTLGDVKQALDQWMAAIERHDLKRIRALSVPDVAISPLSGWLATGTAAQDSLGSFLPRVSSFGLTILDFDASGAMAYVYAGVHYQLATGDSREVIRADASIVLVQRGEAWKVRSYLERPRTDPLP